MGSELARPPFPDQAAFSLDGLPANDDGAPELPPTLLLPALADLRRFTAVYLDRFGASDGPRGQAVLVRGEHGAGKTHALGYLMKLAANRNVPRGAAVRNVLQLYVKAEEPDFVGVYRRLMRRLSPEQLRDLSLRFAAELAADSVADAAGDPELVGMVRAKLREKPKRLYSLAGEYAVDRSEVVARRDAEVDRITGGSDEFRRALWWSLTEVGDLARRWFVGENVTAAECRRLGVTGPIATPEAAKLGVQLLAAVCGRVGTALILYFDQYEKLVLDGDDLIGDNAGMLHTLTEFVPRQDAMLVLCGNNRAWRALPVDLVQRFGTHVVEQPALDIDEAAALVHLYLNPHAEALVRHDYAESELLPFSLGALRMLHLVSAGNTRTLLQLCGATLANVGPGGVVSDDDVRDTAKSVGTDPIDPETVRVEIERIATVTGFEVERLADNGTGRGALRLTRPGAAPMLVMLGQSVHYYDEIVDTDRHVDVLERVKRSAPGARPILVVLGYDSAEVRQALTRAGIEVLSYDPATFGEVFAALLDELTPAPDPERSDALALELAELRRTIAELRSEREQDVRGLMAQATQLQERNDAERLAPRWEAAGKEWIGERRRIEDGIREARAKRRADQLQELERLRDHAERERRMRILQFVALPVVMLVALLVTVAVLPEEAAFAALVAAALLTAWVWCMMLLTSLGRGLFRGRALRELSAPVTSIDDLRRIAHRAALARPPARFVLDNANPQVRFVAAVADFDPDLLERQLPAERSAIVRRALAQRLGASSRNPLAALEGAVRSRTPESVYILEGTLRAGHELSVAGFDPQLQTLAAILRLPHLHAGTRALAAQLEYDALSDDVPEELREIDDALRGGLRFGDRKALSRLSASRLRASARRLTPFEDDGLGTFDELRCVDDVDTAYLTLAQLLFLTELGLLADA